MKNVYHVTISLFARIESDVPMTEEEILADAEAELGIDRCMANETNVWVEKGEMGSEEEDW